MNRIKPEALSTKQRDDATLAELAHAEEKLRSAMEYMPNKVASIFNATDVRDLDRALRIVQEVRSFATHTRAARR